MCDWICYLIMSLDSNSTYIGSTNNPPRRLNDHNNNSPNRRGARRTRGQTWIPILNISGFESKNSCLSFESGWKRLCHTRSNEKLYLINKMADTNYAYSKDTRWNRIMDLLYFIHHITYIDDKFKINYAFKHPINSPDLLTINIFFEEWIENLPWPYFILTNSTSKLNPKGNLFE